MHFKINSNALPQSIMNMPALKYQFNMSWLLQNITLTNNMFAFDFGLFCLKNLKVGKCVIDATYRCNSMLRVNRGKYSSY